jgi:transcriptional regulator with XRE-family HTH domain
MINCDRNTRVQIGGRLKIFRNHLGLIQAQLGKILDMNQTSITSIEKGKSLPTIPVLMYLREHYHLSILWLLTGEGEMIDENLEKKAEPVDYGEYKEEMKDLLFLLDNVQEVREFVLEQFIMYKFRNKKRIREALEREEAGQRAVNDSGGIHESRAEDR